MMSHVGASVTTQIIFPYMSDARTPAMDVQMAAQDACMTRSFHVFLSAMLIVDDGYREFFAQIEGGGERDRGFSLEEMTGKRGDATTCIPFVRDRNTPTRIIYHEGSPGEPARMPVATGLRFCRCDTADN